MPRLSNALLSPKLFAEPDKQLTARQRRFVDAYLANGGKGRAAALAAGYPATSAVSQAHRLTRNPLVQHHILRATAEAIGLAAVGALSTVRKLSTSAQSEYVRLEASKDLLDRAGFRPPDRVDHRVDAGLSVHIDIGPRGVRKPEVQGDDTPLIDSFAEKSSESGSF